MMKKSLLLAVPFSCIAFTLAAQDCTQPVIGEVTGAGTYCPGEEVTLKLTGNLNDATAWTWYAGSCGGTSVGTGDSLVVTVDSTMTYFVRGTGGCVADTAACDTIEVKLDDAGPEILSCPADTLVATEPGMCGATVSFDLPEGIDPCSDTVFIEQVAGPEPGSFFAAGVTEVAYELRDTLGNVSVCSFTVTVADQEPPAITCPADIVADNDPGECGAIITYDVPVGSDNCPDAVTERTAGLGSGAFFPVGVTTETYTVTDAAGNTASCSFTVTVHDVEPPVITLADRKTPVLWPPNHKHHDIAIAGYIESVYDNCGGVTIDDVVIDEVGSDEPNNGTGDGNTTDDIVIAGDCHTASLLAERAGTGNGRVYVVSLALMDLHGNTGAAAFTVEVPHDKGKKHSTIQDSIVYVVNGCDLVFEGGEGDSTAMASGRHTDTGLFAEQLNARVYPNPFNGAFTVSLISDADDHVTIELYNLIGVKVSGLLEQNVEAGHPYEWTFDAQTVKGNQYLLMIRGIRARNVLRIIQRE